MVEGLLNPSDVHSRVRQEISDAVERAVAAGAPPPLEYVGAGQFGIVLCDSNDHAWKVARLANRSPGERNFMLEEFATEYEWLRDAGKTSIRENVAKVYALHPEEIVLERECVRGRVGTWSDDRRLHGLHQDVDDTMKSEGWTAPDFKEDSYIFRSDGTPVLVDISMAMRIGLNLAGWVEDVLDGKRSTKDRWRDLAFYLISERRHKTIPDEKTKELLDRLVELDPEIKRSFSLEGSSLGSEESRGSFDRFHSRLLEKRLLKHQYAKKLIDPAAIAVCLHKPETEHQRERWYAVTPGFPYDEGAWRVSVWDKHGPSTHYSSAMHHGPFLTVLQAVDEVLFEERRARLVEYILPSGEHVRVGKGPSCF
jgi:hypothetical protein